MDAAFDPPAEPPRRSARGLIIVLTILLAFVGGMALAGYAVKQSPKVAALLKIAPAETAQPVPVAALPAPAPVAAPDLATLEERVAGIEDQVERVDQRTTAATGNADRAESLLVAFAARRALDRGMALGYLEGLLRERFGGVDPQAVAAVIAASHAPVRLDELQTELDALRPRLATATSDAGWWDNFKQSLGSLIVIRSAETPSTIPADRLQRAARQLEGGQVDKAMAEIARLPGRAIAADWMARARRYVAARNALDRIETAALLKPHVELPVGGA
ncbi:hypothetical protein PQ455_16600 [Sphingomonas naphthae]|uniref:Inner membrane protein n=1 Tax=Sphingomonas naphthae TaxID=1813468 RepID=A0ABY7TJ10_9SPHN|nr:hypothetical protein [Sphingomonas naphthae]WCT73217.1 hypothetical protein PQ455_16600 [Sphingomonas naphthae]